jgi:transcriptional regulator with XRE-family HTH domain
VDIGNRLRELRLAKGFSETDLATRTGILEDRIAAVEEGREKPTIDTLEAWARELGVEMHQLFLAGEPSLSPPQRDSIGKLSAREKKLIHLFRSLSPADQRDVLFVAKKMAGLDLKK